MKIIKWDATDEGTVTSICYHYIPMCCACCTFVLDFGALVELSSCKKIVVEFVIVLFTLNKCCFR